MAKAHMVITIPIPDDTYDGFLESMFELIKQNGFATDIKTSGKVYVSEAGISKDGVTAAVLDGKMRNG